MRFLRFLRILPLVAITAACGDDAVPPPPAIAPAKPPIRGAVGDSDLRVMLAELAAAKACAMVKNQFRALRDPERPAVATGILWIRDCEITSRGTAVTFRLSG